MSGRHILDITPHEDLQWSMGLLDFNLARALAEFIDNSIDAKQPTKKLVVRVRVDPSQVQVEDNGIGMNVEQLQMALTAGYPKVGSANLGRYGFGLKTASFYLGHRLEVLTVSVGSSYALSVAVDKDRGYQATSSPPGRWKAVATEVPIPTDLGQGTRIVVSKLRHAQGEDAIRAARVHLAKVYRCHLDNHHLEIWINGHQVAPFRFDVLDHPWEPEFTVKAGSGATLRVHGWLGITRLRKKLTLAQTDAGLYLLSGNRVIDYPVWVGMNYHPEVARFTGELHLDGFTLNVNKTGFFTESKEWLDFQHQLKTYIQVHEIRKKVTVIGSELSRPDAPTLRKRPPAAAPTVGLSHSHSGPHSEGSASRNTAPSANAEATVEGDNSSGYRPRGSTREPGHIGTGTAPGTQVTPEAASSPEPSVKRKGAEPKVFIVHGHNHAALRDLEALLRRLGLSPRILEDQPNKGRLLLQKFMEESEGARYVFVLATGDDLGTVKAPAAEQVRARQNVIFELGFFAGKIGFGRVCLLREPEVQLPSDLAGITYIPLNGLISRTRTELEIRRELTAASIPIRG